MNRGILPRSVAHRDVRFAKGDAELQFGDWLGRGFVEGWFEPSHEFLGPGVVHAGVLDEGEEDDGDCQYDGHANEGHNKGGGEEAEAGGHPGEGSAEDGHEGIMNQINGIAHAADQVNGLPGKEAPGPMATKYQDQEYEDQRGQNLAQDDHFNGGQDDHQQQSEGGPIGRRGSIGFLRGQIEVEVGEEEAGQEEGELFEDGKDQDALQRQEREQDDGNSEARAAKPAGEAEHLHQDGHEEIELDFDLQAPGDAVEDGGVLIDEAMGVEKPGQKSGDVVAAHFGIAHQPGGGEEQYEGQNVGRFEPGEAAEVVALDRDRRSALHVVSGKGKGQYETADGEEQFNAESAAREDIGHAALQRIKVPFVCALEGEGDVEQNDGADGEETEAVDFRNKSSTGGDPGEALDPFVDDGRHVAGHQKGNRSGMKMAVMTGKYDRNIGKQKDFVWTKRLRERDAAGAAFIFAFVKRVFQL
ncbi:MAG: hypothetical protein JWR26_4979 [Pedosphaera sp.]|nr:hypothetical protein [Pedosphaera sp.]